MNCKLYHAYMVYGSLQLEEQKCQGLVDVCHKVLVAIICSRHQFCVCCPHSLLLRAQMYTVLAISELSVHVSGFSLRHETLLYDALQKGKALKVLPESCWSHTWRWLCRGRRLRRFIQLSRCCISPCPSAHVSAACKLLGRFRL